MSQIYCGTDATAGGTRLWAAMQNITVGRWCEALRTGGLPVADGGCRPMVFSVSDGQVTVADGVRMGRLPVVDGGCRPMVLTRAGQLMRA